MAGASPSPEDELRPIANQTFVNLESDDTLHLRLAVASRTDEDLAGVLESDEKEAAEDDEVAGLSEANRHTSASNTLLLPHGTVLVPFTQEEFVQLLEGVEEPVSTYVEVLRVFELTCAQVARKTPPKDDDDDDHHHHHHHNNSMAHTMGDLSEPPIDADAQGVVTDFVDFTEHMPADVFRSLALIQQLNETANDASRALHRLLQTHKSLPTMPPKDRPDGVELRKQISHQLDLLTRARYNSAAEATRLSEGVNRQYGRLGAVTRKLEALPKPPSRDPTPAPVSPGVKRSQSGRKLVGVQKLVLHGPDSTRQALKKQHKRRNTRVTVPGEVLPPINPDSPLPSGLSDSDSEPDSPIPVPISKVGGNRKDSKKPEKEMEMEPIKLKLKKPKDKGKEAQRPPRAPGMGTNVHSQVAGISTSNALALLTPPPDDAKPGSVWAPWHRLTEYEMAWLRKTMKKNALWAPSKTMIRKTLYDRGRGWDAYRKAKAEADKKGEEIEDCDNLANWTTGRVLGKGEIGPDEKGGDQDLSNRGMVLNQAKKLKKEKERDLATEMEKALVSQDMVKITDIKTNHAMKMLERSADELKRLSASLQTSGSAGLGNTLETLRNQVAAMNEAVTAIPKVKAKKQISSTKNIVARLSEATTPEVQATAEPNARKRKITKPTPVITDAATITTTIPLLPAGPSTVSKASTPLTSPTDSKAGGADVKPAVNPALRSSAAPKAGTSTTISTPRTRTPSQRVSAAASVEPPTTVTRELRRKSIVSGASAESTPKPPATPTIPTTLASHRAKRPAPGTVTTSNEEGGATVSVTRRKAAPKKGAKTTPAKDKDKELKEKDTKAGKATGVGVAADKEIRVDVDGKTEEIDPNEPRYCVCGDVSYGEMICCENPECKLEWFHMPCVDLTSPPGRTTKWYCPDCRKALHLGEDTNGLVGGGRRRR